MRPPRVPQPEEDQVTTYANRKFSHFSLEHKVYCVPIDHTEQERIDILDEILRRCLQIRDIIPPFPPSRSRTNDRSLPAVLDCGFGGGAWIERLLEDFQGNLDITGVDILLNPPGRQDSDNGNGSNGSSSNGNSSNDNSSGSGNSLSPVQEFEKKRWNLNAAFREDQSEDRLRPETFDLINSRYLADGISTERWPLYIRDLKHLLKFGGWLQMVEIQFDFQSSSGRLPYDSALNRWWRWYSWALQRMNKDALVGRRLGQMLQTQGFADVDTSSLDLPIGNWDPLRAAMGQRVLAVFDQMLESLSLYPLLSVVQMDANTYRSLIAGARNDLRNHEYQLYCKVYVAVGQRTAQRP